MMRLKSHAGELIGTALAGTGAYTSFQANFDFWFRQLGTAVAVVAGGLTALAVLRNEFPQYLPPRLRKKPDVPSTSTNPGP